jgi:hypothetical protein
VLDVGDQELLVLLLVVQPDGDQRLQAPEQLLVGALEELGHPLVHVAAVGEDLRHRGARDVAALRAAVALPRLHVVRVEEEGVDRVQRPVAGRVRLQDEGLEEPARVREMPLRRADVGHRLHHVVLGGQPLAERSGEAPHLRVPVRQRARAGYGVDESSRHKHPWKGRT